MVYDGYGALKTNFSNNDDLTFIVVPPPTTRVPFHTEFVSSSIHCTENSKHIFPEMKLRGLRTYCMKAKIHAKRVAKQKSCAL